jgi:hypothetical protein
MSFRRRLSDSLRGMNQGLGFARSYQKGNPQIPDEGIGGSPSSGLPEEDPVIKEMMLRYGIESIDELPLQLQQLFRR